MSIGQRITKCRNMLGFTRPDLVAKLGGVSVPTLSRWELNSVNIPKLKLQRLVEFFNQYGINVTETWLETGIGFEPKLTDFSDLVNDLNFDEIAINTLDDLKRNIKNFSIMQINSKFFEPVVSYGDYVGGVVSYELEQLHNELCFCISNQVVSAGIFNCNDKCVTNLYKQIISAENADIGKILWLAKRY